MMRIAIVTLLAFPVFASSYSFHLRVADARVAQREAGQPETAPPDTRVLVLDHTQGMHFRWLMLGWPAGKDGVEWAINDRGGAKLTDENADLSFAPKESGLATTRCLRTRCTIHVTGGDRRVDVSLTDGQTAELPLDADYDVELER